MRHLLLGKILCDSEMLAEGANAQAMIEHEKHPSVATLLGNLPHSYSTTMTALKA